MMFRFLFLVVFVTAGKGTKEFAHADDVINRILQSVPIIDGHNDFAYNLRNIVQNDLSKVNFSSNLEEEGAWKNSNVSFTDLPRLRKGRVGAQFWSVYTDCGSQMKDSVIQTLEQIDVVKRLTQAYNSDLEFAQSVSDIEFAWSHGKIASLIGIEGGHSIQSSYAVLRMLYELGARYLTLTHNCNTPWAQSCISDLDQNTNSDGFHGLSDFGLGVIDEMNRLGMMVDLSHVSVATMRMALERSRAPVIFSHSNAYSIRNHHRNVPDDVLQLVKETGSIVMVSFYRRFLRDDHENASVHDVVDHIEYIRNRTGVDHVGIGGDFDGVDEMPEGLEDVSKYPALFKALWQTGRWTETDLKKLAGKNILRVFKQVEQVSELLKDRTSPEQNVLNVLINRKRNSGSTFNINVFNVLLFIVVSLLL